MTDLATIETPAVSTELETETPPAVSGGGTPSPAPEEEAKPEPKSLRDTIAGVVKKADAEKEAEVPAKEADKAAEKAPEKPAEAKPAPEAKEADKGPQRAPDGKFAAKEAEAKPAAEQTPETDQQAKSGGHFEAPRSFLPDAREKWLNVPRPVQRDIATMAQQHEAEITQHREAAQRYESIRPYDEAAQRSGRAGVHESLAEVAKLENLMQTNPLAGLNHVLMQAGPRKADGQPISLFELAQAIVKSGQDGYDRMVSQQPQQANVQRQPDPEVAQLKAQLNEFKEQQLAATVIEPFRAAKPRYDELQGDIAFFLQSGKIPNSLSPSDRLAAAYDMAVRINPASHASDAPQTDLEPARRADETFSAGTSIKSAPGAITPTMEPQRGRSTADILRAEMKKAKVS